MIIQVTKNLFLDTFKKVRPDEFTHKALLYIFEYLEEREKDTGEQIEVDVIGICCNIAEMKNEEIKNSYNLPSSDSNTIQRFLENKTEVIAELEGRFVFFCNF